MLSIQVTVKITDRLIPTPMFTIKQKHDYVVIATLRMRKQNAPVASPGFTSPSHFCTRMHKTVQGASLHAQQ